MVVPFESIKQEEVGGTVVRLFITTLIDDKWVKGIKRKDLKRFFVLYYPAKYDSYIPCWNHNYTTSSGNHLKKTCWWDSKTHDELKSKVREPREGFSSRHDKDHAKILKSAELLGKAKFKYLIHTDNRMEAERAFLKYCHDNGRVDVKAFVNIPEVTS